MSLRKQNPSLCKLSSFWEEASANFFDETDVDICFCYKIIELFQLQHQVAEVSKRSNFFAFKLFDLCNQKTKQRSVFQGKLDFFKREIDCVHDGLCEYLKNWAKLSRVFRFHCQNKKVENDTTKSKVNLF